MTATSVRPPPGFPISAVDPFSTEFFEDPHRIHDELREAGPVVWLSEWGCYAVARYAEVRAVFDDPRRSAPAGASAGPTSPGKRPGVRKA